MLLGWHRRGEAGERRYSASGVGGAPAPAQRLEHQPHIAPGEGVLAGETFGPRRSEEGAGCPRAG